MMVFISNWVQNVCVNFIDFSFKSFSIFESWALEDTFLLIDHAQMNCGLYVLNRGFWWFLKDHAQAMAYMSCNMIWGQQNTGSQILQNVHFQSFFCLALSIIFSSIHANFWPLCVVIHLILWNSILFPIISPGSACDSQQGHVFDQNCSDFLLLLLTPGILWTWIPVLGITSPILWELLFEMCWES